MSSQPQIHFVEAATIEECERRVNAWIEEIDYLSTVLNINVMPLNVGNKLVFLTCVTYVKQTIGASA